MYGRMLPFTGAGGLVVGGVVINQLWLIAFAAALVVVGVWREYAVTTVASTSTGIGSPPAPGACPPASVHVRSRAAARAARSAFSARAGVAASASISRDTVGSDATDPNSSGWARNIATSAKQSPPNANVTARSATTFPGSCTARGLRHPASPTDKPRSSPAARSVSVNSNAPAWATTPDPSPDTTTLAYRPVVFTRKVPSELARTGPLTSPIPPAQRHFSRVNDQAGQIRDERPRLSLNPPANLS